MTQIPEPLWRGALLPDLLNGKTVKGAVPDIGSVSIDTRTLEAGGLFFAIQGEARDGHDFIPQALEKGAIGVIDQAHVAGFEALADKHPGRLIVVEHVLGAMERLGRASRARMNGPVLAITGSVGKTSTKEMMRVALGRVGSVHASIASYNNHWGVPLTLARMPQETDFGVFEIGMSAPFEILPLTAMVRPHVSIVTTVDPVHLAQFPSLSAIADAKGEIFSGLEPGGVAIVNGDNPQAARLAAHAGASRAGRIVWFGRAETADIRMISAHLDPDFTIVSATVFGMPVTYRLNVPGLHLAMNSLAVLGAAHVIGADLALATLGLQDFSTIDGRGKRLILDHGEGRTFTLIDESYNANPSSMRAALAVTGTMPRGGRGRRIAVLGDMLELGPEGADLHANLAEAIETSEIDLVFAAGPLMKSLYQALPYDRRGGYAESAAGLESQILHAVQPGDVVMVKGSNGSKMGSIVLAFKARFVPKGIEADTD